MDEHHPKQVADYTIAALVLIFINLLWIFGVIWVQFGLSAVILPGRALNQGIHWLARFQASRAI